MLLSKINNSTNRVSSGGHLGVGCALLRVVDHDLDVPGAPLPLEVVVEHRQDPQRVGQSGGLRQLW